VTRLTLVPPSDWRHVPWRNGGGTTAEVLAEPGPGGRFLWRLSIADVAAAGPFSDFTGYDRHILLLAGKGFVLRFAEAPARRLDRSLEPFAFDGGWRAGCELVDGPVRDLNLMVSRDRARGALRVIRLAAGERAELPLAGTVLLHLVEGSLEAGGLPLSPGDTLRVDGGEGEPFAVVAGAPSSLVVATVTPAPP